MANLVNWGNHPSSDWIEPWKAARNLSEELGAHPETTNKPTARDRRSIFSVADHWEYGGYPSSLFAESPKARRDFLTRHVANSFPPLPAKAINGNQILPNEVWKMLARHNGYRLETLFKKLRWDVETFDFVIAQLMDRGLIYTIGFRPLSNRPRGDLYYFRDTGLLHHLFNPKWQKDGRHRKHWDRSWEGFVIQLLCHGIGNHANACVWRKADEEIDLLLEWPDRGKRWGVEISRSLDKKPSDGFWAASQVLKLTDEFVIHWGNCDSISSCRRYTLERFLEEFDGA